MRKRKTDVRIRPTRRPASRNGGGSGEPDFTLTVTDIVTGAVRTYDSRLHLGQRRYLRFGYFSFPEVTGDPEFPEVFPEVFVKMLDFRFLIGSFALFHAGLTGFDYTLTVTDTENGSVTTHESAGQFCGAVHTLEP